MKLYGVEKCGMLKISNRAIANGTRGGSETFVKICYELSGNGISIVDTRTTKSNDLSILTECAAVDRIASRIVFATLLYWYGAISYLSSHLTGYHLDFVDVNGSVFKLDPQAAGAINYET